MQGIIINMWGHVPGASDRLSQLTIQVQAKCSYNASKRFRYNSKKFLRIEEILSRFQRIENNIKQLQWIFISLKKKILLAISCEDLNNTLTLINVKKVIFKRPLLGMRSLAKICEDSLYFKRNLKSVNKYN